MVLNKDEQEKLSKRLKALGPDNPAPKVAKLAGISYPTLYKVLKGGSVRKANILAIAKAIKQIEKEAEQEQIEIKRELGVLPEMEEVTG